MHLILPLLLILQVSDALPAIAVRARPSIVTNAPLEYLHIEVYIRRDRRNRAYCVVVDGPDYYSSACEDLSGMTAPALFTTFSLHLDEDGLYTVTATTYDSKGKALNSAEQDVSVGDRLAGEPIIFAPTP